MAWQNRLYSSKNRGKQTNLLFFGVDFDGCAVGSDLVHGGIEVDKVNSCKMSILFVM
jgi:hypothetical protein